MPAAKPPLLRKLQRLSQALAVSGALNIVMLSFFVYWQIKERPPTPYCESKPAAPHERCPPLAMEASGSEVLRLLASMPIEKLLVQLDNNDLVENGYCVRDLAVGSLVTFHGFAIDKAIAGLPELTEWRRLLFDDGMGGKSVMRVCADLTDRHTTAIALFAERERWPLTAEALFRQLKRSQPARDESLCDAFSLTSEYQAAALIIGKGCRSIQGNEIIDMVAEGDWETLSAFTEEQKIRQDLSDARRRSLLFKYIEGGSRTAASILLKSDAAFAVKKLDDDHVIAILKLCTEKSAAAARFALTMLISPRSDRVWREAADRLYEYIGEPKPSQYSRNAVLEKFVSKGSPEPKAAVGATASGARRAYVVQENDSLWKISRRFNVDIEEIKCKNQLKGDTLKPGAILLLP